MATKAGKQTNGKSSSNAARTGPPEFPPEQLALLEKIAQRMHDMGIPEDMEREARRSSRAKARKT
jgi:hypothetical protein